MPSNEGRRGRMLRTKESSAFKFRLSSMKPEHVAERKRYFNALNNDPEIHRRIANSMNEVLQDLSVIE